MNDSCDLLLVGSAGRNRLHRPDGTTVPIVGGPLFHAALATTWSRRHVAVATRMATDDVAMLEPLRVAGLSVFVALAHQTTRSHVFCLSDDVDDRRHVLEATCGPFTLGDATPVDARLTHLVGVNRSEFPIELMTALHDRGAKFSVDMQALVRRAEPQSGEVILEDYADKRLVAEMAETIKLDAVEAELLTGTRDLEQAAVQFERWGCAEVMVTSARGAVVRNEGVTHFAPFTNRDHVGRTGRGDATFAAYLVRRMDEDAAEALAFAVAFASLKMESSGLFQCRLSDVLERRERQQLTVDNDKLELLTKARYGEV